MVPFVSLNSTTIILLSGLSLQVGTSRYMAPEVLEGCITFNRAAYKQIDCYSVGVIFYEIMTRTELNGGECY